MASFGVSDGYAEISFEAHEAAELTIQLQHAVRLTIPVLDDEEMTLSSLERLHRASRMCYELVLSRRLTSLDREDVSVLTWVFARRRQVSRIGFLAPIIEELTEDKLRKSGDVALVGDHYAKLVSSVMES